MSTYTDTHLRVPYFSQYKDVSDADHRLRSCGMTCAYMVLRYFDAEAPSLDEMITAGIRNGGYGPSGWIHEYFVGLFTQKGYGCIRRENMRDADVQDLRKHLEEGNPAIISVTRRLWDQRIFHMVVLTGFRVNEHGELEGFFYHDPASLHDSGIQNAFVPLATFFLDWRRMAILPSKN